MTTIREQLKYFEDYISYCTMSSAEMDAEYDPEVQRRSFTAWSTRWVYFPVILEGAMTIGRVPRSPCSIEVNPVGSAEGESDAS